MLRALVASVDLAAEAWSHTGLACVNIRGKMVKAQQTAGSGFKSGGILGEIPSDS